MLDRSVQQVERAIAFQKETERNLRKKEKTVRRIHREVRDENKILINSVKLLLY